MYLCCRNKIHTLATQPLSSFIPSNIYPFHVSRLITPHPPVSGFRTHCASPKIRLDELCTKLNPQYSRKLVQGWIEDGKVFIDGRAVLKPGQKFLPSTPVSIEADEPKYVCRAGYKLEAALDYFKVNVAGKVALDAGLSTGGFTDCLLQRGASKVFGVDVGHGQVVDAIRNHPHVVVMEHTNVRHMTPDQLPQLVDLATLDLSFISVLKVMPAVSALLAPQGELLVLIKPQFEAGKALVGGGGVVRSKQVHRDVLDRVIKGIQAGGFEFRDCMESPLKGDKGGNTEFLAYFVRGATAGNMPSDSTPLPEAGASSTVQVQCTSLINGL